MMDKIIQQFISQFSLNKIILLAGGIIFLIYIKTPLQLFLEGLSIRFGKRINEGNKVEIAGKKGIVKSVGIRFVIIQGEDGEEIYIPNDRIKYYPSVLFPYPKQKHCEILKRLEALEKHKKKGA